MAALAFPAALGASQSWQFSTDWPNAASFIAIFGPLADHSTGPCWSKTPPSPSTTCPPAPTGTAGPPPATSCCPPAPAPAAPPAGGITGAGDPAIFARYIAGGYFSLIALNFADTTPWTTRSAPTSPPPDYQPSQVIPYGTPRPGTYVIYRYEPAQ